MLFARAIPIIGVQLAPGPCLEGSKILHSNQGRAAFCPFHALRKHSWKTALGEEPPRGVFHREFIPHLTQRKDALRRRWDADGWSAGLRVLV